MDRRIVAATFSGFGRRVRQGLILSLTVSSLCAQVPSLINYQGRLTDEDGSPVSGQKVFKVKIFDAQTSGSVLYSEDLGQVNLDYNGVYSFQFGSEGSSQATSSTSVGVADGSANVFNTVLPEEATGIVSITDGTYTWTPETGSTAPTSFIGSYDGTSKTVSAIYIGGAPSGGAEILAIYKTETDGISAALASGNEHWLELSIDGTTQSSRVRILAVPFAQQSATANTATAISGSSRYEWQPNNWVSLQSPGQMTMAYPIYSKLATSNQEISIECVLPTFFQNLDQIRATVYHRLRDNDQPPITAGINLEVIEVIPNPYSESVVYRGDIQSETRPNHESFTKEYILSPDLTIQKDRIYKIKYYGGRYYNRFPSLTSLKVIGKTGPQN